MRTTKKIIALSISMLLMVTLLAGCGSEAKKAMNEAVSTATELLEKGENPLDKATKKELEKAIASADKGELLGN